jgi:complex iron-sulfur molybdoenzyme family reductase subunit gamma
MAAARPVQDLVALGFGTIGPARSQTVEGRGDRHQGNWRVVVARPFAAPDDERPAFDIGTQTDVAFAIWEGSRGDRNGQKSVSQFVRLDVADAQAPTSTGTLLGVGLAAVGGVLLVALALSGVVNPRRVAPDGASAESGVSG